MVKNVRARKRRRIGQLPKLDYFTPLGNKETDEVIILTLDELESLRLADMQGMYHEDAAKLMGISRATFGRILEDARKKVSEAIIQGKALRVEGGLTTLNVKSQRSNEFCVCPVCGYKKPHTAGIPCRKEICPNCGAHLIREK